MSFAVRVSVRSDWRAFRDQVEGLRKDQLPFATARALTETAKAAQREVTAALPSIFDRPTPFTMQAIGITAARKTDLRALVFVKDVQARYLRLEETGGERVQKPGAPVLPPVDVPLNAFGNIPRGLLKKLKGKKRGQVFVGTVKGVYGFWQRGPLHSIRLLAAFRPRARYQPRFHFITRVQAVAARVFLPTLARTYADALRTARRP